MSGGLESKRDETSPEAMVVAGKFPSVIRKCANPQQNKGVNNKRGAVPKAVHITARRQRHRLRSTTGVAWFTGWSMDSRRRTKTKPGANIRFLAKTLSKLACTAFPLESTCPFHYRGSKSPANNSRTLFLAAASAFLPSGVIRYTVRRDLPYCFAEPRR